MAAHGSNSPGNALVSGASSGIGRELVLLLAADGHRLVLLARNEQRLRELAEECRQRFGTESLVIAADLADPATPPRVFQAAGALGPLDILINNAGFGNHGAFAQIDVRGELELLQVNVLSLTHLSRLFLPGMIQRGHGRIMNVASTAAFVPGPWMSTYYASKAYVLSHTLSLARELRGTGVTVTALCPGPTRTEFHRRAGIVEAPLLRAGVMSAQAVARAGYRGMMRGRPLVVPGLLNKMVVLASRLLPRSVLAAAAGRLNGRRKAVERCT